MGPLKSRQPNRSRQEFTSHAAMCEKTTSQFAAPDQRQPLLYSAPETVHENLEPLPLPPHRRSTPPPNAFTLQ